MPGLTQRLSLPKVHRRLQSVTRPAGTLSEQTESSWHAAYPNVFPLVSPGKLAQTVLGLRSSYRKISFNLLQGELQKSRMSQKPERQNLSNPPSSLNFLLSFFHSLHQFNTLIVMNVRKRQKKQHLRISLCQRVWLLTQQSATAPFACDPEERFISAELLWRALSCHLLERHWPCSLPRLWVRGGRREGQEATFTARLWPRGTGGGCPGEGTHCRKHFPLPTLQNLPNAAGRNAEDHCLLKQRLVQICLLTTPGLLATGHGKAKGEVFPWLPSTSTGQWCSWKCWEGAAPQSWQPCLERHTPSGPT